MTETQHSRVGMLTVTNLLIASLVLGSVGQTLYTLFSAPYAVLLLPATTLFIGYAVLVMLVYKAFPTAPVARETHIAALVARVVVVAAVTLGGAVYFEAIHRKLEVGRQASAESQLKAEVAACVLKVTVTPSRKESEEYCADSANRAKVRSN